MWAYLRKGQSQRTRARLSLEQLEVRQLMAADLLTDASSLFRNPIPTQPTTPIVAVRTIDGTGNNVLHWQWGSTNEELLRVAAAEYGDGVYTLAGADRPSARVISNTIAAQDADTELNDRNISAYIYVFGQFLDHDLDLTTTGTTSAGIAVPKGDDAEVLPDGSVRYGRGGKSLTVTIRNPCPPGDIEHEMAQLSSYRQLPGRGRR